jgi:hypothetical protein
VGLLKGFALTLEGIVIYAIDRRHGDSSAIWRCSYDAVILMCGFARAVATGGGWLEQRKKLKTAAHREADAQSKGTQVPYLP